MDTASVGMSDFVCQRVELGEHDMDILTIIRGVRE